MRFAAAFSVFLAGLIAGPTLTVAETGPAEWSACIAAPDATCVLVLAEAEVAARATDADMAYQRRRLAEVYMLQGRPDLASAIVRQIEDPGDALYLWPDILARRPDPDDVALALSLADGQTNTVSRGIDLTKIAAALAQAGQTDQARAVLDMVEPDRSGFGFLALVEALERAGDIEGVQSALAAIPADWRPEADVALLVARARQEGLGSIAGDMATLESDDQLRLAIRLLPEFPDPGLMALVETAFVVRFGEVDPTRSVIQSAAAAIAATPRDFAVAQAQRFAGADLPPAYRVAILTQVLAATGDAGIAALAVAATDDVDDLFIRTSQRIDIAAYLTDPAHLALLSGWADIPTSPMDRAYVLSEFAAATGDPDLVAQAMAVLPLITDDVDRRRLFAAIVLATARGPDPDSIAPLLPAFGADEWPTRDEALKEAAADMARAGHGALAADLARAMTYDERQAVTLARIGAVEQDPALLAEALTLARDVVSDIYRPGVLIDIADAILTLR